MAQPDINDIIIIAKQAGLILREATKNIMTSK